MHILFPPGYSTEIFLLAAAVLLFLSVVVSKISDRLGIPALLLFLIIGMLTGSEGPGGIYFNDPWFTKSLGIIALIFILFAGGLETKFSDIRPILWRGIALSTIGVLVTAVLVGYFVVAVLHFSLLQGLLIGAIISATDTATVLTVLRSRNVSLKGKLRPLLELESGSNDPMAVFLTLGLIRFLTLQDYTWANFLVEFLLEASVGSLMGYLMGRVFLWAVNRLQLAYEGLYPVLTISLVILTYALTTLLHGNGFLAVYIAALVAGNHNFIHKKTLVRFHEGMAWLMQIIMFLTLGLLVIPSKIVPIIWTGLLISLFLMFVARPVSVFLCLFFSGLSINEKHMVSWVGLRGAVPIILATFPLIAGVPGADMIFNIVFFIVLTSILFQGTSIPLVSRLLKVNEPLKNKRPYPIEFELADTFNASLEEAIVPFNSAVAGKRIFELGIPPGCLVVLLGRDEKFFIPDGKTVLEAGDVLLILANTQDMRQLQKILSTPAHSDS